MPKSLHDRLKEKGWSEEDISKTHELLYSSEKLEKHAHFAHKSHPIIYWAGLIIAVVANLLLCLVLIPFIIILSSGALYFILGVVGLIFGAMFNHIIKDIEHVDQKHHIAAGIFIPATALITVYFMTSISNKFVEILNLENLHSPVLMSLLYIFCFTLPYLSYKIKDILGQRPALSRQNI